MNKSSKPSLGVQLTRFVYFPTTFREAISNTGAPILWRLGSQFRGYHSPSIAPFPHHFFTALSNQRSTIDSAVNYPVNALLTLLLTLKYREISHVNDVNPFPEGWGARETLLLNFVLNFLGHQWE